MISLASFLVALAAAAWVVVGYPIVLWLLAKKSHPVRAAGEAVRKSVSVIVPVHNGERFLPAKLQSLLDLDYPRELVEIVVVSDGSTDDTDAIALSFADRGVSLLRVPHGGKPAALNAAIPAASGEILVLTDVRQELAVDCLQTLVNNFADPAVGVVSGHLIIRRGASRDESEVGLYWRYETWIRDNLSRLDSMFGATGPIYAIRKNLARPLPPDILLDDMALPLFAFFEGWRLIVEPAARAYDVPTGRDVEFTRKVRTLAGNWQLLRYQPKLLTPANRMLWHYLSYKLGRLLLPFFLMTIAAASFGLIEPLRTIVLFAQLTFYALAAVDALLPTKFFLRKISSPAHTFCVMMFAALASLQVFFVDPRSLWKPTNVVMARREWR